MLYLNGKIISENEARIDPQDRGFLLGDGLFETLRCQGGQPLMLTAHWQRLEAGAHFLQLPLPISLDETTAIVADLLKINQLNDLAGARLTITRGIGPRGLVIPAHCQPTVLIKTLPINVNQTPLRVCISDIPINEQSPLTRYKTVNYLDRVMARQLALQQDFDDAILLNTQRHVVSSTNANLFIVKNNELLTPSIEEGALPGITRQQVITLSKRLKIKTHETVTTVDDLSNADEIFLTNSLTGLRSVASIAGIPFQAASMVVTKKLQRNVIWQIQTN